MNNYQKGYSDGFGDVVNRRVKVGPGKVVQIPEGPDDYGVGMAIITAALIIAIAMLGCAVFDYFTYRELPDAPVDEIHSGPSYII